jgi:hypothetical protein
MTRSLVLAAAALAAIAWLVRQPAFAHDNPHKRAGALIAITVPFLLLDIILTIRKSRRARARSSSSPASTAGRARAGAGRW